MRPKDGDFKQRELPKEGFHKARIIWWIDLGTQKTFFNNVSSEKLKVKIGYELVGLYPKEPFNPDKGLQPFMVSKDYTLTMDDRGNLKKHLVGIMGRSFKEKELNDIDNIPGYLSKMFIGKPCYVQVRHSEPNDKKIVFANIASVMKVPEELGAVKPAENPLVVFDMEIPEKAQEVFKILPKNIQKKIEDSPEWNYNPINDGGIAPAEDVPEDEF